MLSKIQKYFNILTKHQYICDSVEFDENTCYQTFIHVTKQICITLKIVIPPMLYKDIEKLENIYLSSHITSNASSSNYMSNAWNIWRIVKLSDMTCQIKRIEIEGEDIPILSNIESKIILGGGQQTVKYYCMDFPVHRHYPLSMLDNILDIFNNGYEHEINILNCHCKNIKTVTEKYLPILKEFDFNPVTIQLFNQYYDDNETLADPLIIYKHNYTDLTISFSTDCVTGELRFENKKMSNISDFRQYIIENFLTSSSDKCIKIEYRYLFDDAYDIQTYNEFRKLTNTIHMSYNPEILLKSYSSINLDFLPDKDFKILKDQLNNKLKSDIIKYSEKQQSFQKSNIYCADDGCIKAPIDPAIDEVSTF